MCPGATPLWSAFASCITRWRHNVSALKGQAHVTFLALMREMRPLVGQCTHRPRASLTSRRALLSCGHGHGTRVTGTPARSRRSAARGRPGGISDRNGLRPGGQRQQSRCSPQDLSSERSPIDPSGDRAHRSSALSAALGARHDTRCQKTRGGLLARSADLGRQARACGERRDHGRAGHRGHPCAESSDRTAAAQCLRWRNRGAFRESLRSRESDPCRARPRGIRRGSEDRARWR